MHASRLFPFCSRPLLLHFTTLHHSTQTALQDGSDLFRHDVAFCLGQRQDPAAVDILKALVADSSQHAM